MVRLIARLIMIILILVTAFDSFYKYGKGEIKKNKLVSDLIGICINIVLLYLGGFFDNFIYLK